MAPSNSVKHSIFWQQLETGVRNTGDPCESSVPYYFESSLPTFWGQ